MSKQTDKTCDVGVLTRERPKTKKPKKYRVLLWNDDYTSVVFVAQILQEIFHFDKRGAEALTMSIHREGKGVAGVYSRDIAETKVVQVIQKAQQNKYPLRATAEPE